MDILVRSYQKVGTSAMISMRDRLFTIKLRKFDSLAKLFDEYDLILRELERMGAEVSTVEKILALLIALPAKHNHVKGALKVLPNEVLCRKPIVDIKRMFLDAESVFNDRGEGSQPPNIALMNKKATNVCFGCGERGHYKSKCPKLRKKKQEKKNAPKGKQQFAMVAGRSGVTKQRKVRFVVDSGASSHMVNDERLLHDAETLERPIEISTAKTGETLRATKRGKLRLVSVIGENKIKKLDLYNVLFAPCLEENLLSVRKANSMGKRVTFQDGFVSFESEGELIAQGELDDSGLFCLDLFANVDPTAYTSNEQVSIEAWHKRLGHLSYSGIEKMIKKEMVEGINCNLENINPPKLCESCIAGKQCSLNFKIMDLPRSSRPLELVHSDVCGFMEKVTFDGFKFFVTFTDDYTHFTVVYLLKRKSEVYDKFQEFEAMATAHFGVKLSQLRCDNGGEYLGNEFHSYCKAKGIQPILTVPYTPQQNGVSERLNRTLMDKVRAMLYESGLPKEMWGEALYVATYLCNRSPTNALVENKTPFEMWFGKRPDLAKLRTFDCNGYVQIPK